MPLDSHRCVVHIQASKNTMQSQVHSARLPITRLVEPPRQQYSRLRAQRIEVARDEIPVQHLSELRYSPPPTPSTTCPYRLPSWAGNKGRVPRPLRLGTSSPPPLPPRRPTHRERNRTISERSARRTSAATCIPWRRRRNTCRKPEHFRTRPSGSSLSGLSTPWLYPTHSARWPLSTRILSEYPHG